MSGLLALVIVLLVVVALLCVLVAGLLRSHADILRALEDLGAGVGDPAVAPERAAAAPAAAPVPADRAPPPLHLGPPLPPERNSTAAFDLTGQSPAGEALSLAVTGVDRTTLLVFLSSGCTTCAAIWAALGHPAAAGLPPHVRVVAVTKGPEFEIPGEVAQRAPDGLAVVMSTQAWGDYEVPGSPFFVLVDGAARRRVGEGVAARLEQIADLVRRSEVDARPPAGGGLPVGLDGPAREARNDEELRRAGILPGDPSLYPRSHEDLFAPADGVPRRPPVGAGEGTV